MEYGCMTVQGIKLQYLVAFAKQWRKKKRIDTKRLPGKEKKKQHNECENIRLIHSIWWHGMKSTQSSMKKDDGNSYVNLNDATIWKIRETVIRIYALRIGALLMSQSITLKWSHCQWQANKNKNQSNGEKSGTNIKQHAMLNSIQQNDLRYIDNLRKYLCSLPKQ